MLKISVLLIGNEPQTGIEKVLGKVESIDGDILAIDTMVHRVMDSGSAEIEGSDPKAWALEVSVRMTSDEHGVHRPSLSLEASTMARLGESGCSLEFDPYL